MNKNTHGNKTAYKLSFIVIFSAVLMLLGLGLLISNLKIAQISYVSLDDLLSADVIHTDGKVEHSDSNYFSPARQDDLIKINVPLPEEYRKDAQALCFDFYNSIVTVSFDDKILYSYGEQRAVKNRHIGHLIISIGIPEEAWGKSLTISALVQENDPYTNIKGVYLMDAVDAKLYPLMGKEFDFIIFVPLFILSLTAGIAFLVAVIAGYRNLSQGLYLSLFLALLSAWYLGYQGIFYLFSSNITFNAEIEYQALYLFMIPFLAYIRRENMSETSKKILLYLEIGFILFAIIVFASYLTGTGIDYSDHINVLRLYIILTLIVIMLTLILNRKIEHSNSDKILRYGLFSIMVIGIVETIRISAVSLINVTDDSILGSFINMNFSRIMILIFLFSLIGNFVLRIFDNIRKETERMQLSRLAYFDILTGIPNRQDCDRRFNEMTIEELHKASVAFFDANDLKIANDQYGHDAGDTLLKCVGEALKTAMVGLQGFYGRFGGDEFIACLFDAKDIDVLKNRFFECIDSFNNKNLLPLKISVAFGYATYKDLEPNVPEQTNYLIAGLIRKADENMYHNKQEMKINRAPR